MSKRNQFVSDVDKIYQAIRKTYGYDEEADRLVDLVGGMAEVSEDKF